MLRDFIARAEAYGIDYNLIEAFDQPWKTNEGSVGAYWGVFDASRQAKFAWTGPVSDPDYWKVAGLAVLLGLLLSLPILAEDPRDHRRGHHAGGRRQRGRRLVRDRLRLLERPLLRARRRFRVRARHPAADSAGRSSRSPGSRRSPPSLSGAARGA